MNNEKLEYYFEEKNMLNLLVLWLLVHACQRSNSTLLKVANIYFKISKKWAEIFVKLLVIIFHMSLALDPYCITKIEVTGWSGLQIICFGL